MKKIINGRLYDTETATLLGSYDNGENDVYNITEELYRKCTGEYFIFVEGGALTEYSRPCGNNMTTWGYKFISVSLEQAKRWAEEHMDADDYMKEFGEVEE